MRALIGAAAAALLLAGPALAGPVTLKANPVDADGQITLGDVFDGAGPASGVVVGARSGPSAVFEAGQLQAMARQAGLDWANPTGLRRVVVRHAAAAPAAATVSPAAGTAAPAPARATPTQTGNRYDMAVDGRGYFQILMPSGETAYTRAGKFSVNGEGQLVTDDGYAVQPNISIPQDAVDVSISKSGQVQVITAGETEPSIVGQLELASFFNEAGLEAIGDNLLMETAASGAANVGTPGEVGFGQLLHGYTEASNVDAVAEISALIIAQRAYEMNSKVITTADQMLSVSAQVKS